MPRMLPVARGAAGYAVAQPILTWPFVWLCLLVLSFCYELPLALITHYDRTNPRLFDIVTLLGIVTVLPIVSWSRPLPVVFRRWAWLVAWFVFCALMWALLWLPWQEAGRYSLFFAARYVQGLIALYIAAIIPLGRDQKKILHYVVVLGGIVVALYAIPEYRQGGYVRPLTDEMAFRPPPGSVLSSLGPTYFHVAMFSTMACAMSFALVGYARGYLSRWMAFAAGLFTAWPATVCGSRAGLLGVGLVFAGAFLVIRGLRSRLAAFAVMLFVVMAAGFVRMPTTQDLMEVSRSFERFVSLGEREGAAIADRAAWGMDLERTLSLYEWQGLRVPLLGAGFYVAPHSDGSGELFYRTGYGFHNIYIFPLEQAGVVGFVLFLWLMVTCFREIWKKVKLPDGVDKWFAMGVLVFAGAMCIVGWAGQVFWQGFGTENFNTFILLLFILATKPTGPVQPTALRRS